MASADQLRQAIRENPRGALARALDFFRSGDSRRASALCQNIIKVLPGYVDAWLLLCQLQLSMERADRALECADRALQLQPGNLRAGLLRAESLAADAQFDAALVALESLEPEVADGALTLRLIGNIYAGLDCYEKACQMFRQSLSLDGSDVECWHLYSGALFARGLFTEAADALAEVLRLDPAHSEALLTQSSMQKQTSSDNNIRQLERALDACTAASPDAVRIQYALSKELEDIGHYDAAFEFLKSAADQNDRLLNYTVERDEAFMADVTSLYRERIASGDRQPSLGEGVVFIASLPRAGSTLVDRILASHSRAVSLGETNAFHEALVQQAREASAVNRMTFVDALAEIDYPALGRAYLKRLRTSARADRVVIDKTPNNIQYLGLIHQALPAAQIIHVYKSPMDACYSLYRNYFSRGNGYSYKLENLGRHYLAYRAMMSQWRCILPGVILDVSYEELVNNQEAQSRRVLQHCQLGWEPNCLDFHLNQSPTATASVVQVRQPLYHSSVERWRHYEAQLQPLLDILRNGGIEVDL